MRVNITVAMMTHNETKEFRWLMESMVAALDRIDEIVVVDDFSNPDFIATVREFGNKAPLRFFQRALKKDFASQRNYVKSLCRGRLIFFPDPDELPSTRVLRGLPQILDMMEERDIDACQLPRLNIWFRSDGAVDPRSLDLDEEHVPYENRFRVLQNRDLFSDQASLDLNDKRPAMLWEDQFRIIRNLPHLRWRLRMHEYLSGVRRGYRFPRSLEYALLHCKTYERQARQFAFYRSVRMRHLSRMRNSVLKRLPWRQRTVWISSGVPI